MYPHYCAVHGPVPVPAPMGYFPMMAYSPQHKGYGYAPSPQQQQYNNSNNNNNNKSSPTSKGRNHNNINNNNNNNNSNHQYDRNDDVFGNNLGCPSAVKTSRYNKLQQTQTPASPNVIAATTQTPHHQVTATPNASGRRTVPHNTTTSAQTQEPHTPAPVAASSAMKNANNIINSSSNNNMATSPAAASSQAGTKALPPNSGISTSVRVKPITGRQLERDLSLATKEELLQMLVELSTLHPAAQSFITCRAALLVLQGKEGANSTTATADTAATPLAAHKATPSAATTGLKGTTVAAAARAPSSSVSNTPVAVSSPQIGMSRSPATSNARINAENRPFTAVGEGSTDHLHPCLRTYGRCRHPASCPFRSLPRNVCLAWLRKECSSGLDCPHVHRLPGDDPALDIVALPRRADEQEQQRGVVPAAGAQVRLLYRLYQDESSRRDPRVVQEMCLLSMEQLAQRYNKGELEQECHEEECEEAPLEQQPIEQQEGSYSASHNSNSSAPRREGASTAVGSPVEGVDNTTTVPVVTFPPPTEHTPVARALDLNA